MRKLILFLSISILSFNLFSQEECAFILEESQEMFDAGLIETVPEKLADCLNTGFTNEEKLQAYKLIILSYLFDDNIVKADETMLQFLTDYPAYEPVATDPREFIVLMESYDRDPVLMIGGGFGINLAHTIPTLLQGINDFTDHDGNYVPGGVGFQATFRAEKELNTNLVFNAELSFFNSAFDYYLDNDDEVIIPSGEITDFSVVEYYETQNSLSLPVSLYYSFTETDFKPYVRLGISPRFLFTATGESKRVYLNTGDIKYEDIDVANVNLIEGRRKINLWGFAGAGFNYSLGPGNLFFDVRYYANLLNQVKPGTNSFMFDELIWSQFYVSDKFLLNNITVSAGYMFPLYRPKKKVTE